MLPASSAVVLAPPGASCSSASTATAGARVGEAGTAARKRFHSFSLTSEIAVMDGAGPGGRGTSNHVGGSIGHAGPPVEAYCRAISRLTELQREQVIEANGLNFFRKKMLSSRHWLRLRTRAGWLLRSHTRLELDAPLLTAPRAAAQYIGHVALNQSDIAVGWLGQGAALPGMPLGPRPSALLSPRRRAHAAAQLA